MFGFLRRRNGAGAPETKQASTGGLLAIFGQAMPRLTPRDYEHLAQESYLYNAIAYRCVSLLARNVADLPLVVYRRKGDGALEPDPDSSAARLLRRPNPVTSQTSFIESLVAARLLAGNAYAEAVGPRDAREPRELWWLRPDRMAIKPGRQGVAAAYQYKIGVSTQTWSVDPLRGQSPIFHWKAFHPTDDWYGLSPVEPAAYPIDLHNKALRWVNSLLDNSARPSGALEMAARADDGGPAELTEKQFERLKQEIFEQYQGAANAGRPMLLEGGLTWRQLGMSPNDLQLNATQNQAARDICQPFGVPPQLVGIPDAQTYSNWEQARLALFEDGVLPLGRDLASALTVFLQPKFGDDLEIGVDEDRVTALAPRRAQQWDKAIKGFKGRILTRDEARSMLGFGESGDDGFAEPGADAPTPGQGGRGGDDDSVAQTGKAGRVQERLEGFGFSEEAARELARKAYGDDG